MRGYWLNPEHESSRVVRNLHSLDFARNVIPHEWCQNLITTASRPPLLTDIMILGEIVYWHRPVVISKEGSTNVVFRKKFKGDLLQLKKRRFCSKFGFSMGQVDRSLRYLEAQGLIFRELRTIFKADGEPLPNVQFIGLNFERLAEISPQKTSEESGRESSETSAERDGGMDADEDSLPTPTTIGMDVGDDTLPTQTAMGMPVDGETYTKTTTEITTESTTQSTSVGEDIYTDAPPSHSSSTGTSRGVISAETKKLVKPKSNTLPDPSLHQTMKEACGRVMVLDVELFSKRLKKFANELVKNGFTPAEIEVWIGDESELPAVRKRYGEELVNSIPHHGWHRSNHWAFLDNGQDPNEHTIRESLSKIRKQLENSGYKSDVAGTSGDLAGTSSDGADSSSDATMPHYIAEMFDNYGERETRLYLYYHEYDGISNGRWFKFLNKWWRWIEARENANDTADAVIREESAF